MNTKFVTDYEDDYFRHVILIFIYSVFILFTLVEHGKIYCKLLFCLWKTIASLIMSYFIFLKLILTEKETISFGKNILSRNGKFFLANIEA